MNFIGVGICIYSLIIYVFDIFFLFGGLLIIWSCCCFYFLSVIVYMWVNVDDIIEENEVMVGLFYSFGYCIII